MASCEVALVEGREPYSTDEALRKGLVNAVVSHSQFMGEVDQLFDETFISVSLGLSIAKPVVSDSTDFLDLAFAHRTETLSFTFDSGESRGGVTVLLEKRQPNLFQFRQLR